MIGEKQKLKDVCIRITKGTTPSTYGFPFVDSGINFVKAESILEGGGILPNTFAYIDEATHEYLKRSILCDNDILISIAGAKLGKCGFLTEEYLPANTNQAVGIVRVDQNYADPKFVYYNFVSNHTYQLINSLNSQAAQPNLNLGQLGELEFHFPKLPTQRKIASILSAYDDLIENNLKRIELLEEKLIIEYSLLEEESKNQKELDFSDFVTLVKGIEPGSSNYLSEKSEGTIPFIRVGDLSKRESEIFIEEEKSKGIICNPDDVLVSMDGTIGIVKYGIYGCYSSGIRKAVSNGILNNAFIFCYLSSPKIQGVIYSHSKGSTIQHASSSIKHFKIKLPKETSLKGFIKSSTPIYELINILLKQNTKLREVRDILLPKLMSGQIEV